MDINTTVGGGKDTDMKVNLDNENYVESIDLRWTRDDVFHKAKEMEVVITMEQASEVLEALLDNHDANFGVSWDMIEIEIRKVLED